MLTRYLSSDGRLALMCDTSEKGHVRFNLFISHCMAFDSPLLVVTIGYICIMEEGHQAAFLVQQKLWVRSSCCFTLTCPVEMTRAFHCSAWITRQKHKKELER